ncbi:MAG: hypothetical protein AAFZ87_11975, partial [Planctomycetota bacterium]
EFRNGFLAAAFVLYDREGGGQNSLQDMVDAILAALANKSNLDHTHVLGDIQGGTEGKFAAFDATGTLVEVDAPSGGSGPVTQDLDIADFAIVSGGVELMRYDQGDLFLRGRRVFTSNIDAPVEGQVPAWNASEGEFRNSFVTAAMLAADLRALTVDGGNILLPGLPKSDPATPDALWNDGGTLKVSAGAV